MAKKVKITTYTEGGQMNEVHYFDLEKVYMKDIENFRDNLVKKGIKYDWSYTD